ncbi:MAG: nuclear transport factor 2 family protein [Chloracidobacterium sp.]|nr:nuclear transport factor 2 family protein [Chloracidobacterium sp.]
MKKIFLMSMMLVVAAFFTACGGSGANTASNKPANATSNAAAAPAPDKATVEAEVRKALDEFNAALNGSNTAALEKMYSDEYTLIDQNGAMQTKVSRIEAVKSGKLKWEGLKFNDLKIKTHPTGDGAIVTALVAGKMTIDGKTEERNSMVTWVLGKSKDKGWQIMNAQITDIKGGAAKSDNNTKSVDGTAQPPKATGNPKVDAVVGDDIPPPKKK